MFAGFELRERKADKHDGFEDDDDPQAHQRPHHALGESVVIVRSARFVGMMRATERYAAVVPELYVRAGLGGRDKADADRRAATRTLEGRERRGGLAQRWNEPQIVGVRHNALALGATEFAKPQFCMRGL
jgi:hypothetical protein